jgi:hypothetical protein
MRKENNSFPCLKLIAEAERVIVLSTSILTYMMRQYLLGRINFQCIIYCSQHDAIKSVEVSPAQANRLHLAE